MEPINRSNLAQVVKQVHLYGSDSEMPSGESWIKAAVLNG